MNNDTSKDRLDNNSGDSSVQDGKGIEKEEKKSTDITKQPEEFVSPSNNSTKIANENSATNIH